MRVLLLPDVALSLSVDARKTRGGFTLAYTLALALSQVSPFLTQLGYMHAKGTYQLRGDSTRV